MLKAFPLFFETYLLGSVWATGAEDRRVAMETERDLLSVVRHDTCCGHDRY